MGQCIFPGKIVMPLTQEENKTPARQAAPLGKISASLQGRFAITTSRACDPACLWLLEIPQNPIDDGGRETLRDETCRHQVAMSYE